MANTNIRPRGAVAAWHPASAPAPPGNVFYVDQTNGNDTYDGTEQTHTTGNTGPWKTLAKVYTASTGFVGDDQILFKRGETWHEKFGIQSSGTSGHPITFDAYGEGAQPIFDGSDVVTTWTNTSGNIWQKSMAAPFQLWFGGVRVGEAKASQGDLAVDNDWWYEIISWPTTGTLFIYSTADPNGKTIEVSFRNCVELANKDYINFNNIHTTKGKYGHYWASGSAYVTMNNITSDWNRYDGVFCDDNGSNHWTINNAICHDNGIPNQAYPSSGISFHNNGGTATQLVDGGEFYNHLAIYGCGVCCDLNMTPPIEVRNTTCHDNYYGIKATTSVDGMYTHHNTVYNCISFGIDMDTGPSNSRVEYNIVYGCGSHSIAFEDTGATTTTSTCIGNIVYDGPGAGSAIECNNSGGILIAYNVLYDHPTGIECYLSGASNNLIYNNTINNCHNGITIQGATDCVAKNNIIDNPETDLYYMNIDNTASPTFVSDNNFFGHMGNAYLRCQTSLTKVLATWKTNSGHDANSLSGDPLFVNPATGNFHLQEGSTCINAGVSVGLSTDLEGNPITGNPDMGAYEYQP